MGTDIHMYLEKKVKGKWAAADKYMTEDREIGEDVPHCYKIYHERNYLLFRVLAGVRGFPIPSLWQKYPVKGFPEDASPQVTKIYKRYDVDAHTPSYLTLKELRAVPWGEGGATVPIQFNVTARQKEIYEFAKKKYYEKKGKFVQGAWTVPKPYQVDFFVFSTIEKPWHSICEIFLKPNVETPLYEIYTWVPLKYALPDFDRDVIQKLGEICRVERLKDDEIRIVFFFDN